MAKSADAAGVGFLAFLLNCVTGDVLAWEIAGEEPVLGSF